MAHSITRSDSCHAPRFTRIDRLPGVPDAGLCYDVRRDVHAITVTCPSCGIDHSMTQGVYDGLCLLDIPALCDACTVDRLTLPACGIRAGARFADLFAEGANNRPVLPRRLAAPWTDGPMYGPHHHPLQGDSIMLIPSRMFAMTAQADDASSRYALCGIRFERNGQHADPHAIATDRRVLVAASWNEPNAAEHPAPDDYKERWTGTKADDFATIIPVADCKAAVKLVRMTKKQREDKPIRDCIALSETSTNGKAPMYASDGSQSANMAPDTLDGRFPHWRDCVPAYTRENSVSVYLNAKMLMDLVKTVSTISQLDSDHPGVTVTVRDDNSAVLVTSDRTAPTDWQGGGCGVGVCGVIMPFKSPHKQKGRNAPEIQPEWLPTGATSVPACPTAKKDEHADLLESLRFILRVETESHNPEHFNTVEHLRGALARVRAIAYDAIEDCK